MVRPPMVVFSDLDGALLDHETYEFDAARPALDRLRRDGVPLVLCTSKTRAEVEPIERRSTIDTRSLSRTAAASTSRRCTFHST